MDAFLLANGKQIKERYWSLVKTMSEPSATKNSAYLGSEFKLNIVMALSTRPLVSN